MSGHNLGIVLARLFAIYLAITALQSLFFSVPSMDHNIARLGNYRWKLCCCGLYQLPAAA